MSRSPRQATTCIVFSVPENRLSAMDVAIGPAVPLPGRTTSIVSVHAQQGGESAENMRDLFVVLGGSPLERDEALERFAEVGDGLLYRCSATFLNLMVEEEAATLRVLHEEQAGGESETPRWLARRNALDEAWLAGSSWHPDQVSTGNKLFRLGLARMAHEKGQALYCWYGPSVPEYVIESGTGPYPGSSKKRRG
ncbi:hypothetical protein EYE40_06545 [Glaciihabitans arcticus]|uniref:Uncharacterized protein n=1 Tax=Glaciihabitans arcticus TaxID=2668039 RepID=A0A4Q9GQE3_9MICO|nr:hypothetical protein [Glaciihabitans arcticus]TBN57086.1 hypothetical protein EYE40_06545 [Glaciihabitans arcticus]